MNNSLRDDSRKHINLVAAEVLKKFVDISGIASGKLNDERVPEINALAYVNTLTTTAAAQKLKDIIHENHESYQVLSNEPAIARVVVANNEGERKTYYICRTIPVPGIPNLASYRAPVGRLASQKVGSEFILPDGSPVEVLEREQLNPHRSKNDWDSRDTVIETKNFGLLTIKSLADLIVVAREENDNDSEDILARVKVEEEAKRIIIEGFSRSLITKVGLRDQPVLDEYQDEIFRLPLNKRLLILGPPGTGKTTTLIRRLGQKLDKVFLEEYEKSIVEELEKINGIKHSDSWLMFSPTDLLKLYLKEAFAREGVPASDFRIKTWKDYRQDIARNVFGILRTPSTQGPFTLKPELPSLNELALEQPTKWYDDFLAWQNRTYVEGLHKASVYLCEAQDSHFKNIGERLQAAITTSDGNLVRLLELLVLDNANVQMMVAQLKKFSDSKIEEALKLQLRNNPNFLEDLARTIDGIGQIQTTDSEEQDEFDTEDDEDESVPQTARSVAIDAYMKAARAQARSAVTKRVINKNSRNGKIVQWLSGRGLSESDSIEVGDSLLLQVNARHFVNPVKRLLSSIPKRYRLFRRENLGTLDWYKKEGFSSKEINPLELDIILLAILRTSNELISRDNIFRNIGNPEWSALQPILYLYRNQILVDEATDFSSVQLACMASLSHPKLGSFFACGDYNQRLTLWGTRSLEDLTWISKNFDIKDVSISYRQTKQLNSLAHSIIQIMGGAKQETHVPDYMGETGVAPVLLEHADDKEEIACWLAGRIREIESLVKQFPSTAILVNSEDEVTPFTKALNTALSEYNIPVIACHEGRDIGQEGSVRVFDVKHIKGLEFEAVFFVGIDKLAIQQPTLFEKYLYVGVTRAATYLGLTCEGSLPESIQCLSDHFIQDWQNPNGL